jgi:LysR family transcriptional regulator (chromosome initiation inhibitor)
MGWGLQPLVLIEAHLRDGSLVELVPGTPLDVTLFWQYARAASALLEGLSRDVVASAGRALMGLAHGAHRTNR